MFRNLLSTEKTQLPVDMFSIVRIKEYREGILKALKRG